MRKSSGVMIVLLLNHPAVGPRSSITAQISASIDNIERTYADPWMLQCFAGSDPLSWIHRQHLIDKILGFRRDGVPFRTRVLSNKAIKYDTIK